MKIFDSNFNSKWTGTGFTLENGTLVLYKNVNIFHTIPFKKSSYTLKIFGKNRTGTGDINIKLLGTKDELLFNNNFVFSKNWSEEYIKFDINSEHKFGKIIITRPKNIYGSIEIGRIILDLEQKIENKNIKKSKELMFENIAMLYTKKKIAFIIPYGIYGGAEVYLKSLINLLNSDIFDITLIYLKNNPIQHFITDNLCTHKHIKTEDHLYNFLSSQNYNYIVYYNSRMVYNYLTNYVENNTTNSKLIEIYHSDFKWGDSLSTLKNRQNLHLLFSVSDNLANDIANIPKKIHLPVPIDIKKFFPKYEFKDKKIIGTVARLSEEKRIDYILDLAKVLTEYEFHIIGNGPLEQHLNQRIIKEKITNVKLLGFKQDVSSFYQTFSAFLLTSSMEGTPISILEAMASGLPVFTTNVGNICDIVKDKFTGFYLTNNLNKDAEIIKDNIDNLEVGEHARQFIEANHDQAKVIDIFVKSILEFSIKFLERKDERILDGEYL